MKVLIISHNVIDPRTSMGKTLHSYFQAFSPEEVAQFYIYKEAPADDTICRNYYRFTDGDAVRSLVRPFGKRDARCHLKTSQNHGLLEKAYRFGRRRTAGVYILRNLLWKCCRWDSGEFWQWVKAFDPDIVFLASGDYGFLYQIAEKIAVRTGKPLVISCVDDFYLYNRNGQSLLGRMAHHFFLKTVKRTMDRAAAVVTICPAMQERYRELFGKPCHVLHTPAKERTMPPAKERMQVSYLGALGLQRHLQLVQMGRALKELNLPGGPRRIDVYSGEKDPDILKLLTEENGLRFHGEIPAEAVSEVMNRSMAVIHTESFDAKVRGIIRFSVSTKIADSLMNGPCLIAYGPEGIASMDYVAEHQAAYRITRQEDLKAGLQKILTDPDLRTQIRNRAKTLARKNHSMEKNPQLLRGWLEQVCAQRKGKNDDNHADQLRI